MNIGIIGQGFVGEAVRQGLSSYFNIETYDKYVPQKSTCQSLLDLCEKANILFLCLPTPMNKDGSCNLSIVEESINQINEASHGKHIVVIKSTVPPGTTEKFNHQYDNVNLVFNPEFLTEANYIDDFKNQNRIIIGGPRPYSTKIKNIYERVFKNVPIIKTSSTIAEMVKYTANCFLATKVSFANEIKQVCENIDIDYDKVIEYATYDERLGASHWKVPGPDGKLGFGGSCFPKDINALISFAKNRNISLSVLEAAWKTNLRMRPGRDWEELKGRAVNKENQNQKED
jgi:UDPglucose 6-dehydrogenase